jgi:hypothetical protein
MQVLYDVEALVTAVADERNPADLVLAAIAYHYPQLGARLAGDPRPSVDLAVGQVMESRRVRGRVRVREVRVRLRARVDEEVAEERVRRAVLEKLSEALDSPADGEITELAATRVAVESIYLPAGVGDAGVVAKTRLQSSES